MRIQNIALSCIPRAHSRVAPAEEEQANPFDGLRVFEAPPRGTPGVYGISHTNAFTPRLPITRMGPFVFRGGRPTASDCKVLKIFGVNSIIDLETPELLTGTTKKTLQKEEAAANAAGIDVLFEPLPAATLRSLNKFQINRVLNAINDACEKGEGVYIHCHKGRDRTGLIIGLYRIYFCHWSPKDAWTEMLYFGFSSFLYPLYAYFVREIQPLRDRRSASAQVQPDPL